MKCGELGFTNADGEPCGQNVPSGAKSCLWHDTSPKGQRKAALERQRGGLTARMKSALPETYLVKPFDSIESIVSWSQEMAGIVLTQDLDPRRAAEARGFAQLALNAHQIRVQQQLVTALQTLEHGGAAFVMAERLLTSISTGTRRPLPGRRALPEVITEANEQS